MKPMPKKHDTASVFGLGRSGRALVAHLVSLGVSVYAFDDLKREELGDVPLWLASLGVPLFAGGEGEARGEFVFRTPGMRPDSPVLCRAALRGATVMGEAEYFSMLCPCPIYAVTGSSGKTTTASMLAGLLSMAGKRVYLGGNIGRSLLPFLSEMRKEDVCVLELSSFQAMDMACRFACGIVTNLSENHLNWHRGMEEYTEAKRRVALLSDTCVLRSGLFADLSARRFSAEGDADFCCKDGVLYGFGIPLLRATDVRVRGVHNLENLLAAAAAAADTVTPGVVKRFAMRFGGVSHRMEQVFEIDGVAFYNSSIDTTPARTAATLGAMETEGRILLLLGGRGKNLSLSPLVCAVRQSGALCFLFGEMRDALAEALDTAGLPYLCADTMQDAFLLAANAAVRGDAVLLSPGGTAFDEFVDYEARGESFRRLVYMRKTEKHSKK